MAAPDPFYPYNQPLPAVIPSVTQSAFPFRLDQTTRLFLQLTPQATPNFASEAAAQTKSNWDALIAATDETKIVFTPMFSDPKIPMSKPIKTAQDSNITVAGVPDYFGETIISFTATFRSKDAASMLSMRNLTQFSLQNTIAQTSLGAYFMNKDGYLFMNSDFSTFQIFNFRVGSRGSEGLNSADIVEMSFDLLPTWDQELICVIPTFDPRMYNS